MGPRPVLIAWVGSRAGLEKTVKRKNSSPCREPNPVVQHVVIILTELYRLHSRD
jgi:hypothetical protein